MADAQNEKESGTADATAAVNAAGQAAQATDEADDKAAEDQTDVEAGQPEEDAQEDKASATSDKGSAQSDSDNDDAESDDSTDSADSSDEKDDANEKSDADDDLSEDVKSTVNALLDSKALESKDAPSNVKRLANREKDNNRRVQDTIKNAKTNPKWFVPLFVTLLIVGLAWVIVYYATSQQGPGYPIPAIGNWNLLIGFLIMLAGFIMTMWWN